MIFVKFTSLIFQYRGLLGLHTITKTKLLLSVASERAEPSVLCVEVIKAAHKRESLTATSTAKYRLYIKVEAGRVWAFFDLAASDF